MNDINITNGAINVPSGVDVTLVSGDNDGVTLYVEGNFRHFIISGRLALEEEQGMGVVTLTRIDPNASAVGISGGIHIIDGGEFILNAGVITGNRTANGHGGSGVRVSGSGAIFIMNDGEISSNRVFNLGEGHGGGVYLENGAAFDMNGGVIRNNAARRGGGVGIRDSTFTMNGGVIRNNAGNGSDMSGHIIGLHGDGGGVSVLGAGVFVMYYGDILDNTALGTGGGVYLGNARLTGTWSTYETFGNPLFIMHYGEVRGNVTSARGGGVNVSNGGMFVMKNGGIISNSTTTNAIPTDNSVHLSGGGGVFVGETGSSFIMEDGEIRDNSTLPAGGGVHVSGAAAFTMNGGTIHRNTCTSSITVAAHVNVLGGGGVFVGRAGSVFTMNDGYIKGNQAIRGGGVHVTSNAIFNLKGGTISYNEATAIGATGVNATNDGNGGGVSVVGAANHHTKFNMYGGNINNNSAERGGGVHIWGATATSTIEFFMINGLISGNSALRGGGIYRSAVGTHFIGHSGAFLSNIATFNGGGIYVAGITTYLATIPTAPLTSPMRYLRITLSEDVIFSGNWAGNGAFNPPAELENIAYRIPLSFASTSVFNHPINNFDINYVFGSVAEVDLIITYITDKSRGIFTGVGAPDLREESITISGPSAISPHWHPQEVPEVDYSDTKYIFIGWLKFIGESTTGVFVSYDEIDDVVIVADTTFVAQYELLGGGSNGDQLGQLPGVPNTGYGVTSSEITDVNLRVLGVVFGVVGVIAVSILIVRTLLPVKS
ncbi:autotransporter adhesin family protein [Candidatus Saccharibacteria bacterium]|nr:autotransporter adhesin family protein [Candidatus Saccharibacteria bacterium]